MAYLVTSAYFTRELTIPTLEDMNAKASVELDMFIDEKSPLLLQNALGLELFADLDSNITDGELDALAPQKWKNLVEGAEYTKDGVDYVWKGLLYNVGTYKCSLLAYFTFYFWLENQVSYMAGVGDVQAMAKNAPHVNPNQRLVSVWNKFIEMYQGHGNYHNGSFYFHNGVPVYDYWGGRQENHYVDMITFIKDNQTDYPDARCQLYEVKNQFGL